MNLPSTARGFTLIELIVLIVVFFGSVTSLLSVAIEAAKRVGENKDSSTAIQLAQEKAEIILSDRRNPGLGYAYVTAGNYGLENPVPGFSDFSRSTAVTDASSNTLCPSATAGCKLVVVTVSKNSQTLGTETFMLANFL